MKKKKNENVFNSMINRTMAVNEFFEAKNKNKTTTTAAAINDIQMALLPKNHSREKQKKLIFIHRINRTDERGKKTEKK